MKKEKQLDLGLLSKISLAIFLPLFIKRLKQLKTMKKTEFPHFTSQLVSKTLELLKCRYQTTQLKDIAEATSLSTSWVSAFLNEQLKHPSASRVEKLYVYLSGKPLFPDNAQ